jgi:hypothetical protein
MVVDSGPLRLRSGRGGWGLARNLQEGPHISTNRSRHGWTSGACGNVIAPTEWDGPVVVVDEDMTSSPVRGCQNAHRAGPPAATSKRSGAPYPVSAKACMTAEVTSATRSVGTRAMAEPPNPPPSSGRPGCRGPLPPGRRRQARGRRSRSRRAWRHAKRRTRGQLRAAALRAAGPPSGVPVRSRSRHVWPEPES